LPDQRPSRTVVIALGGNAITAEDQLGTHEEMLANCMEMAWAICDLVEKGWRVVIAHGNGPQVGNISLQQTAAEPDVPAQPMGSLVAMTQGWLGGLIELSLRNLGGPDFPTVVTVVTHVLVDLDDPGFANPTKPIGHFYTRLVAQEKELLGWQIIEDSGRGYRRVVASPQPIAILEAEAIGSLVDNGFLVIAAGGGGIPIAGDSGSLAGVDAVVDKDRAAALLASQLQADALVLVTAVDTVLLDFGTPTQRALEEVGAEEMRGHLRDGQFPPGSMGPKVESSLRYLQDCDGMAVITSVGMLVSALDDAVRAGTRITRSAARVS